MTLRTQTGVSVPQVVGVLGWLAAAVVVLTLYRAWQVALPLAGMHANDFKHLWLGARLLHLGSSPYDEALLGQLALSHGLGGINPYVYLPFTGLSLTPVARLPFAEAAHLWFWISQAALILTVTLTAVHATWGSRWWAGGWLAAIGLVLAAWMMPLFRQFTAGQLNCVLALTLVVVLLAVERRWDWLAGLAIAFGALFKIAPGLFIAYLLWKRAWRLLGWTALWLAILGGWSLWQAGLQTHLDFLPLLADMRVGHSTWAHHGMAFYCDPANQALGSFFLHIFASGHDWNRFNDPDIRPWLDLGEGAANALTVALTLGLLALLIWLTRRGWTREGPSPDVWRAEWSLVVLGSLLIPSLCWDHYAVQLLPVLMVGLWATSTADGFGLRARIVMGTLWLVAALLLAVWVHYPLPPEPMRSGWGLVVMSTRLWGMLLMLGLAVWWRLKAVESPENR